MSGAVLCSVTKEAGECARVAFSAARKGECGGPLRECPVRRGGEVYATGTRSAFQQA